MATRSKTSTHSDHGVFTTVNLPVDATVQVGDTVFDSTANVPAVCSATGPVAWKALVAATTLESVSIAANVAGKTINISSDGQARFESISGDTYVDAGNITWIDAALSVYIRPGGGNFVCQVGNDTSIITAGSTTIESYDATWGNILINTARNVEFSLNDSANQCDYGHALQIKSGTDINARFTARGDYFPNARKYIYDGMIGDYNHDMWTLGGVGTPASAINSTYKGGGITLSTSTASDDSVSLSNKNSHGWLGVTGGAVVRAYVLIPTITSIRVEVGLRNVGSGEYCAFVFETDVGSPPNVPGVDSHWQTYTDTGAATTINASGVVVAAATVYELMFACSDTQGIDFFINGTFIVNHATNLPASDACEAYIETTTRTTALRSVVVFSHYASDGIAV